MHINLSHFANQRRRHHLQCFSRQSHFRRKARVERPHRLGADSARRLAVGRIWIATGVGAFSQSARTLRALTRPRVSLVGDFVSPHPNVALNIFAMQW